MPDRTLHDISNLSEAGPIRQDNLFIGFAVSGATDVKALVVEHREV